MLTNGARGILAFADVEHVDFSVLCHCGTPLLRSQSQLLVGSVTKKPRRCRPKSKCLVWAVCVAGRMVPNEAGPYTSALAGLESFGPLLFVSKSCSFVLPGPAPHGPPVPANLTKHSMMSSTGHKFPNPESEPEISVPVPELFEPEIPDPYFG